MFYRALFRPLTQDELAALKECSTGLPNLAPLFDVKRGENLIATLMSFAEHGQQPWLNDNNIRSAMVEAANALLENVINEFVDTRTFLTNADCPDLNTEIDDTEFQANFYLFLFCCEILMAFAPTNRNLVVLATGTFKFMPFFIPTELAWQRRVLNHCLQEESLRAFTQVATLRPSLSQYRKFVLGKGQLIHET